MALSRLRLRLAAGFAIAFGFALSLLALGSLGYLWRESRARLDTRLAGVAHGVVEAVQREALETPDSALGFAIDEVIEEWPRTGDHWLVTDDHGALLGDTISAIAPGNLSQRIPGAGARDEISTLSIEFNRLFERLEAAQQRNRQFIQEAAHQIRTPLALVLARAATADTTSSAGRRVPGSFASPRTPGRTGG